MDFESITSTIPSHRHKLSFRIIAQSGDKFKSYFCKVEKKYFYDMFPADSVKKYYHFIMLCVRMRRCCIIGENATYFSMVLEGNLT